MLFSLLVPLHQRSSLRLTVTAKWRHFSYCHMISEIDVKFLSYWSILKSNMDKHPKKHRIFCTSLQFNQIFFVLPSKSRKSHPHRILIGEVFNGLEDQPFIFPKHINVLDAFLQFLPGHKEEGLLSLDKLLLSKLRLPVRSTWVKDHTVLMVGQGDLGHSHNLSWVCVRLMMWGW